MRPKKVILCVDADELALSVRKFLLETRGFRVVTAANSEQAIDLFAAKEFSLVVTNLCLPRMNGDDLIRHLKEIDADTPMILTSDKVRPGERSHGADAFLGKGSCSSDLIERARVMSARKRGPKKGFGSYRKPVESVRPASADELWRLA